MRCSFVSVFFLGLAACGTSSSAPVSATASDAQAPDDAAAGSDAGDGGTTPYDGGSGPATLRIAAGNLSTGSNQSYDPGEGIRILQGLKPDVALLQELNYGANADADVRKLVDTAFGPSFSYYREPGAQIPNAVVSRYPILASGAWTDPEVGNRKLVYAKLQIPGAHPLWAISLHLLTSGPDARDLEAQAIVAQVKAIAAPDDFVVVGGDFNTDTRAEACITTLGAIVVTAAPYPSDGSGNANTSQARSKPHDWVLVSPGLTALQTPTVIGANSFTAGLVFDSRVYTPIADVAPALMTDCATPNMQHMAVVRDFKLQ